MGLPKLIRARDLVCETLPYEDNPRVSFQKWLKQNPNKLIADIQFLKPRYVSDGVGFVLYVHPEAEGYYIGPEVDRRGITATPSEECDG
jgi:hypothetical protein